MCHNLDINILHVKMLKSVGVTLSPVKIGVNSLQPESETTKNWKFYRKFQRNSKEIKVKIPEKILVDQGQQYDENDIPEYFLYERR